MSRALESSPSSSLLSRPGGSPVSDLPLAVELVVLPHFGKTLMLGDPGLQHRNLQHSVLGYGVVGA